MFRLTKIPQEKTKICPGYFISLFYFLLKCFSAKLNTEILLVAPMYSLQDSDFLGPPAVILSPISTETMAFAYAGIFPLQALLKFLLSHTQGINSLWIPHLPISQTHSVCFLLQGSFPAELAVLLASGCFQKLKTLLIPLGNLRIKDLCFLLGNDDAIIYSSAVFCLLLLGRISKALIS